MTDRYPASTVMQRQALPGPVRTSCAPPAPWLLVRHVALTAAALLLNGALAGCGGGDISAEAPAGVDLGAKVLKAEEDSGQSGRLNTIDTVIADMEKRNDIVLRGYESERYGWYVGPGSTHMGNNPTFRNSPYWSTFGNDSAYTGQTAKAMLPWLAVFDGVNHEASNVAVEFRNMRAYVKSRSTGEWSLMGGPAKATGLNYGKARTGLSPRQEVVVASSDTSSTILIEDDPRYFWHGWWDAGRKSIDPYDIDAFFVTVQARLAVGDWSKPDERWKAELGLQVGADYHMETWLEWEQTAPNIGISRTKRLTDSWQPFSYTTLSDVGSQVPGGGITESEFRADPPPLE